MNNYPLGVYKALRKIIKHRWALYKAAKVMGVPMRRILAHDNSKFHPVEFMQYVKRFELGIEDAHRWARAWRHHWRHNDHHIEYWQNQSLAFSWSGPGVYDTGIDFGNGIVGEGNLMRVQSGSPVWMPDCAIREMIADWMAASYAYSGAWPKAPDWQWGNKNLVSTLMKLEHTNQPETSTRGFAMELLQKHGMITEEQYKACNFVYSTEPQYPAPEGRDDD